MCKRANGEVEEERKMLREGEVERGGAFLLLVPLICAHARSKERKRGRCTQWKSCPSRDRGIERGDAERWREKKRRRKRREMEEKKEKEDWNFRYHPHASVCVSGRKRV